MKWREWLWDPKIAAEYFGFGAGLGFGATVALVLLHYLQVVCPR